MKIILIGKSGCGKTTLIQRFENRALDYEKTQSVQYHLNFIDTPGEYLEGKGFYKALIATAVDADVIALVQDCTAEESIFPPWFSSAFAKEMIGIITKVDLASSEEQLQNARDILHEAGAYELYEVSAVADTGMEPLHKLVFGPENEA